MQKSSIKLLISDRFVKYPLVQDIHIYMSGQPALQSFVQAVTAEAGDTHLFS